MREKQRRKIARTLELIVAVNVSARQFRQSDFVTQVCTVLEASGAKPTRLKLELTERQVELPERHGAVGFPHWSAHQPEVPGLM